MNMNSKIILLYEVSNPRIIDASFKTSMYNIIYAKKFLKYASQTHSKDSQNSFRPFFLQYYNRCIINPLKKI